MSQEEQHAFVYVRDFLHKMREEDFVMCSCYNTHFSPGEMQIPMPPYIPHMTKEEAVEKGWRITKSPWACRPGDAYAWVCPDCMKKYEEKLIDN